MSQIPSSPFPAKLIVPKINPRTKMHDRYIIQNHGLSNRILAITSQNIQTRASRLENRHIDSQPFKILDAPGLIDDYYLNILDWSQTDIVSIGLNESIYSYNILTKNVTETLTLSDKHITSLKSFKNSLAVGISTGDLNILDVSTNKIYFNTKISDSRIASIDYNGTLLTLGCKNGQIVNVDLRSNTQIKLPSHHGEVCGLKWSNNGTFLATGSNDNTIKIFLSTHLNPRHVFTEHKSAVKAMSWCPWRSGILATGGGTKDKSIKVWDVESGIKMKDVETSSQVCTLNYVEKYKELISSHGYSENDIVIWKGNGMKKMCSFGKHESRVLHVAVNKDGSCICSVSADENLKFWKIYESGDVKSRRDSFTFR